MPPVANTEMPAMWAIIMVVVTVQAPSSPLAMSTGRSRRLALAMSPPFLPAAKPQYQLKRNNFISRPQDAKLRRKNHEQVP